MPKPLLLTRPSGLYVRFLVPIDLRSQIGSRFLVRSLGHHRADQARLVAAALAVALSQVFRVLRRGGNMVDIKKLLESAQNAADDGSLRPWTATGVQIGRVNLGNVQVEGPQDTQDFIDTVRALLDSPSNTAPTPASPREEPTRAPPEPSPLLSVEIADLQRRQLAADTITESKHSLRIFIGILGDIPVREIKATHIRAFLDAIRWWPERATILPQYRGMSVKQIVEAGKKADVPMPSPHTLNKHHQRLGAFLNGLVNLDLINKNPLKAIKPDIDTSTDPESGRVFTDDELKTMFDPDRFRAWADNSPHRWWGLMLGLYTGARVNEVAQLFLDDVREIDGVWGVFFWKNGRGQKIKNKSSIRFVPLAQPLLDAGFLDFIADIRATGHPRLFPHLPAGTKADGTANGKGYGKQLSRQTGAYMKTFGIEKGTAFHAFRHTISTSLAELGVPSTEIALITGHAVGTQVPTLDKHYIHIAQTATLPLRVATLAKFKPPVALLKYKKGQFAAALADTSTLHP